jgi:hypothetical protein
MPSKALWICTDCRSNSLGTKNKKVKLANSSREHKNKRSINTFIGVSDLYMSFHHRDLGFITEFNQIVTETYSSVV